MPSAYQWTKIISTHDLARRSTAFGRLYNLALVFQLTTSQGGRLNTCSFYTSYKYFNSRPRKEVDDQRVAHQEWRRYFNSRPRKEVDIYLAEWEDVEKLFQLTTSQGGRPWNQLARKASNLFQLTTSQGGRQHEPVPCCIFLYFNSRPRKEVDWKHAEKGVSMDAFQLTTSQGGRRLLRLIQQR